MISLNPLNKVIIGLDTNQIRALQCKMNFNIQTKSTGTTSM